MSSNIAKANSKVNKQSINIAAEMPYWLLRVGSLISFVLLFFPSLNACRICGKISKNLSIFTTAVSYKNLVSFVKSDIRLKIIPESAFKSLSAAAIIMLLGIVVASICACMSLGNKRMRKVALPGGILGTVIVIIGLMIVKTSSYASLVNAVGSNDSTKIEPGMTSAWTIYLILMIVIALGYVWAYLTMGKITPGDPDELKMEMPTKYKLFLILLPFLLLCFIFSYLPLFGWRYALYDYSIGETLSADKFVGMKWFKFLLKDPQTRKTFGIVIRNTMIMSGLGILTSWIPMAFAIFLNEIKTPWFKRMVQVFTTIPNFVSWVIVYSLALALFNSDGLINILTGGNTIYLQEYPQWTWFQMLAWGTWKGVGWAAIIYIAGISGIPQDLYEAATVDGAGRFQKMIHITLPGLMPTFFVLLLMSIGNILSNGIDQYLVFSNSKNMEYINVLDLYVYNMGLGDADLVPLSTVISMSKSLISLVLLFLANRVSKSVRGESIM